MYNSKTFMNMVTEDYVSFVTAKLLMEKGFEGDCKYIQDPNNNPYSNSGALVSYPKPTLQMALKWLREVHNIWIEFVFETTGGHVSEYKFKLHFLKADHSGFEISNRAYVGYYKTYEEAADNAISYCLEREI